MFFIKIFIITYNNDKILNRCLKSLFNSDFIKHKNTQVNIINNYSKININDEFKNKINIINNECRGDYFEPNLAQNFNQAIIHGFKSLINPDTEFVVHTHNDIVFYKKWVENLLECSKKYNFIVGSIGDQFVAYKVNAIKKIGLWDENFIGLCHKEADYYLRAYLLNKKKSYINDTFHNRTFNNEIKYIFDMKMRDKTNNIIKNSYKISNKYSNKYFMYKWTNTSSINTEYDGWLINWNKYNLLKKLKKLPFKIKLFVKYYFFEKDIETLKQQNYYL